MLCGKRKSQCHARGDRFAVQQAVGEAGLGFERVTNVPGSTYRDNSTIVIVPSPIAMHRQPIYLYVAPGHQRQWAKYCVRYQACGQPVYFVQEEWVRERAAPQWSAPGAHHGRGDGDEHSRRHGPKHGDD